MSTSAVAISLPVALEDPRVDHSKRTSGTRPPLELTERAEQPMVELDQTPGSEHENGSDLEQIKGIGPVVLKTLVEHGLDSCSDLAGYTPARLARLLKAEIPSMSAKRIERENWIGQAQMRACRQDESLPLKSEMDNTTEPPRQAYTGDPAKATRKNWREVADFFVSFGFVIDPQGKELQKTRVHHSQADIPAEWDGIATDELVNWMLKQAGLPLPAKPPSVEAEALASPVSVAEYDARIEILEIQLSEVSATSGGWGKTLRAQVHLRVSGPDAEMLAKGQIPIQINLYTVDLENETSAMVASTVSRLELPKTEFTQHMVFPVPGLGRYELHSIAFTVPPSRLLAAYRGPTLKVVL